MTSTGGFSHCAESATGRARLDMCQHEFRIVRALRLWPIDSMLTPSDDDSPCLLSTDQRAESSTMLTTRVCWVLVDGKRKVRLPCLSPYSDLKRALTPGVDALDPPPPARPQSQVPFQPR